MSLRKTIVGQFKNPHGYLGRIAGWIMANRRSNRERNDWTVDLLNIRSRDRVIEIGCGPGLALAACLERAVFLINCYSGQFKILIGTAPRRYL